MGFYSDFIEDGEKTIRDLNRVNMDKRWLENVDEKLRSMAIMEATTLAVQVSAMKSARIIRMPGEQAQIFMDMPRVAGQDLTKLRSPFPFMYIEPFNTPFKFVSFWDNLEGKMYHDVVVKGVLIISVEGKHIDYSLQMPRVPLVRGFQVHFMVPLPGQEEKKNTYCASFGVGEDGRLVQPEQSITERPVGFGVVVNNISETCVTWAMHMMNYLTSPTVVLDQHQPSEALQKARSKRGKEPLPGWYEIQYTKSRIKYEPNVNPGQGSKHGFRYDVRGHFAHFTRGRMQGRVIWIPPHQRGIANTLYKPKTYRTDGTKELPDSSDLYRG